MGYVNDLIIIQKTAIALAAKERIENQTLNPLRGFSSVTMYYPNFFLCDPCVLLRLSALFR